MGIKKAARSPPARDRPIVHRHCRIDPSFDAPDPHRVAGASVTFEPGARHRMAYASPRPNLSSRQAAAGRSAGVVPIQEIGPEMWSGPAGRKNWHSATPTMATPHRHSGSLDGKTATGWRRSATNSTAVIMLPPHAELWLRLRDRGDLDPPGRRAT